MTTNKGTLIKGLKTLSISAIFMFLGPALYHIALSNKEKPLYIPILILAIIISALAIYFVFRGINIVLNSMFKK